VLKIAMCHLWCLRVASVRQEGEKIARVFRVGYAYWARREGGSCAYKDCISKASGLLLGHNSLDICL